METKEAIITLHDLDFDVIYIIREDQEEVTYNEDYSGSPFMGGEIDVTGVDLQGIDVFEMADKTGLLFQIKQEVIKLENV